ncbi:DNA starvation/stationary phase protection protein [Hymenobacter sp. BT175]|uniref:Dps family protein n=1 Tax=Hymenobacter translucens TaxID=2886507 RepID=UPI001D0ED3EB|nr:DNA starvation/stationary phase protection protein [Hymenobacter translucens]MCC2546556.1 DNA starvation/stationary phase protection protein [Hymenobacter translucens]
MATKETTKKASSSKAAGKGAASSNGQAAVQPGNVEQPILNQRADMLQRFGIVTPRMPVGLDAKVRQQSVDMLNQLLVDTITLRDLYKKHHWQVVGPTFYQLHLLYDKHYEEQNVLVDAIAERIQLLGGVSYAMAPDVAENTAIPRAPRDREEAPVQVSRLLEAHEIILKECHEYAKKSDDAGDDGTNDLIVSQLIRTNELQAWFVSEHVVDTPLARS